MNSFSYSFNMYVSLVKRHLKVLFTNSIRLFYTLMVPIILLVVYFIFLRELEVSTVERELLKLGVDTSINEFISDIKCVIDSWMLSGVIALSSITISLQICSLIVEDKANKVSRDFVSSPVKKHILVLSYFTFLFIVTFILSFIVFIVSIICLAILSELVISFIDALILILLILYTTIIACLSALFISTLIKSEPVLASISTIVSTAAGFLIGAYMPLGMLPTSVQYFCLFIPWTYSCALIRYGLLNVPLNNLSNFIKSNSSLLPANLSVDDVNKIINTNFSYELNFFGNYIGPSYSFLISLIFTFIFVLLCIFFSRKLFILDEVRKVKKKNVSL